MCKLDNGSLQSICNNSGLDTGDKSSLNKYKKDIREAIFNEPWDYLKYCFFDTKSLFKLIDSKVQSFNAVMEKLNIPSSQYFTEYTIPISLGSQVSQVYTKYLDHVIFESNPLYHLSLKKLSLLNFNHPQFAQALEAYTFLNTFNSYSELEQFYKKNTVIFNEKFSILSEKNIFLESVFSAASISNI